MSHLCDLELQDALCYVKGVKARVPPRVYAEFLQVLRAYKGDWCAQMCSARHALTNFSLTWRRDRGAAA